MHADTLKYINDDNIEVAVKHTIASLKHRWSQAHYRADIESVVWSAAATLFTKPIEQRTMSMLWLIADRMIFREVDKMRHVFVVDFQTDKSYHDIPCEDEHRDIDDITFNSLDDIEKRYVHWVIDDDLSLVDIAELEGVSTGTISRRWKKIINKLKEENLC